MASLLGCNKAILAFVWVILVTSLFMGKVNSSLVASGCLEDPISYFEVFDDQLEFVAAASFCLQRNMTLARISDATENVFVAGLIADIPDKTFFDVWIGQNYLLFLNQIKF